MNERTEKLLRELAEKLGTTAEHLWSVLIREAGIEAVTGIVLLIGTALSLVVFLWLTRLAWIKASDSSEDVWIFPAIVLSTGSLIFAIALAVQVSEVGLIVSGFCNPEYWAFKQIIH
jgi:hypothetical protein